MRFTGAAARLISASHTAPEHQQHPGPLQTPLVREDAWMFAAHRPHQHLRCSIRATASSTLLICSLAEPDKRCTLQCEGLRLLWSLSLWSSGNHVLEDCGVLDLVVPQLPAPSYSCSECVLHTGEEMLMFLAHPQGPLPQHHHPIKMSTVKCEPNCCREEQP